MSDHTENKGTAGELPKEFAEFIEKIAKLETPDLDLSYRDAVNYLDEEFAYFLTHVLNIGAPQWQGMVPTAAVAMPEKARKISDFIFVFNPNFVKLMQLEEVRGEKVNEREAMAFILAHETMHVLLNHLKLFKSDRFKDKMRLNIAADCVINDWLENMGLYGIPGLARGEEQVGYNAANATVSQVYHDLPEAPECPTCNGEGEVSDGEGDQDGEGQPQDGEGAEGGQGGTKPCPTCKGSGQNPGGYGVRPIDSHEWIHDSTADQQAAAEKAGENNPQDLDRTKQDDEFQSGLNPGVGVGSASAFSELHDVGLKWAELLKRVDPFIFKRGPKETDSWNERPRKLAALPQNTVNLPVRKRRTKKGDDGTKPAIVMALDTSGSIGDEQANQFVNMARSVPQDKVKLFVCTFTTQYQELDLDEPEWHSGGTAFDPISEYIETEVMPKNRKKYPTAVIVVTDGYASFNAKRPNEKQAKNWTWLFTQGSTPDKKALPGTHDELDKYRRTKR